MGGSEREWHLYGGSTLFIGLTSSPLCFLLFRPGLLLHVSPPTNHQSTPTHCMHQRRTSDDTNSNITSEIWSDRANMWILSEPERANSGCAWGRTSIDRGNTSRPPNEYQRHSCMPISICDPQQPEGGTIGAVDHLPRNLILHRPHPPSGDRCPALHADGSSVLCFSFSLSTTVFSHASTVVFCGACSTVLCQPTGGKARLTEGCSFRRKVE